MGPEIWSRRLGRFLDARELGSIPATFRADSGPTCRCRANVINVSNGVNVIKLDSTSIVIVFVSLLYNYTLCVKRLAACLHFFT